MEGAKPFEGKCDLVPTPLLMARALGISCVYIALCVSLEPTARGSAAVYAEDTVDGGFGIFSVLARDVGSFAL